VLAGRLAHDARWYLGRLWFDAVAYGAAELGFVSEAVGRSNKYGRGGSTGVEGGRKEGASRMLFGTDHPFFPPLGETGKWRSVVENLEAIETVSEWSEEDKGGVSGRNAVLLFGLLRNGS
jgi:aminocarboxymuconate-semialdehyde decarboxylase